MGSKAGSRMILGNTMTHAQIIKSRQASADPMFSGIDKGTDTTKTGSLLTGVYTN